MKFRFCGEGDCPDWVLAEIHSNLAVLSSDQLREVARYVAGCIVGEEVPEDKVRAIFGVTKGPMDTPKAAFACIRFLLIFMLNWEIFDLNKKLEAFANVYSIIDTWTVDCLSQLITTVDAIMTACTLKAYGEWDKKDAKIFKEYSLHHSINCKQCGRAVKISKPSLLKHLKECKPPADEHVSREELIEEVLEIALGVPRKAKAGPSQSTPTVAASKQNNVKPCDDQSKTKELVGSAKRRRKRKSDSSQQTKQDTLSQSSSTLSIKQNHPKQVDSQNNKPNEHTTGSDKSVKKKPDASQQPLVKLSKSNKISSPITVKQSDTPKQMNELKSKSEMESKENIVNGGVPVDSDSSVSTVSTSSGTTTTTSEPDSSDQENNNNTAKGARPKREVHKPLWFYSGKYLTKGSIPNEKVELTKKLKHFFTNVKPQSLLANGDRRRKEISNSPAHDRIVETLESLFRTTHPRVKAFPFGSRLTGLGKETSDLDIYLDLEGNYDGLRNYSKEKLKAFVLLAEKYLAKSGQWDDLDPVTQARTPIVRAWNRKEKIDCDISFTHGLSDCNTKLVQYLFDLQPVCFYVALYAKEWSHQFNMHGLNTYTLILLTVFYFQKQNLLPCIHSLQKNCKNPLFISHWRADFERKTLEELNISKVPETDAEEHLHKFFSFYGTKFCFETRVVCPFLGWAPQKEDLDPEDCEIPLEMETLQRYYAKIDMTEAHPVNDLLSYTKAMVVQDPFELNHNVAKGIVAVNVNRFRKYCALTAQMLNDVPNGKA